MFTASIEINNFKDANNSFVQPAVMYTAYVGTTKKIKLTDNSILEVRMQKGQTIIFENGYE
ncbi:hypothetical protein FRZ67_06195 [Panacibacter ginsenosidivorans]|uniref:Uncharacterized protein n=1 Tax=Panacibacter ginsenosidivorans TaxID=1813871 RepID=A0A5B8V6Z5_9BACT|nr:hypothetical protein [Panacibacter ginsenosidivorans]QEC66905.1 hypothetical protein FRZ67_06195 [Panacibacter ginsenosidivorans]